MMRPLSRLMLARLDGIARAGGEIHRADLGDRDWHSLGSRACLTRKSAGVYKLTERGWIVAQAYQVGKYQREAIEETT